MALLASAPHHWHTGPFVKGSWQTGHLAGNKGETSAIGISPGESESLCQITKFLSWAKALRYVPNSLRTTGAVASLMPSIQVRGRDFLMAQESRCQTGRAR